ncbi:MAG TPA: tRNA (adenine(22)-N(1))-methyltransferase TrmK [Virgibacillus sp.]|nr:tRNA (adenine(22)-N(1))-methyltransferase TrmK [Virgibacillus sp.]
MKLSKRLSTVASFISTKTYFADIGSDHAYLPCYVCSNDRTVTAIAGEVNKGPYKSALATVRSYDLESHIKVKLGDGLDVIKNEQVVEVVLAGMGGALIKNILTNGKEQLDPVNRIIAQPNIGEENVRQWFMRNDYILTDEKIIEENNLFYEIVVGEKGNKKSPYQKEIEAKQLFFGPFLLRDRSTEFLNKWTLNQRKYEQTISDMKQAKHKDESKIKQFETKLAWIKEVVEDGGQNKKFDTL